MTKTEYKNRKYTIEPYNPEWKKQFETEAESLHPIFQNEAISIEHIGSTAVPRLAGKPTIDILVTVEKIEIADELSKKIEGIGYKSLGDYINKGSRLFVKEANDTRLVNLHVFEAEHPHVKDMLDLRNYFRTHPEIVEEYSNLKFELTKKYSNDYELYRKYKDEWMRKLMNKVKNHFKLRVMLGKLVSIENEENWWRIELFEKNTRALLPPELEIIAPPPKEDQNYNCFVYVLALQNDQRFLGNAGWKFTRNLGLVFDEMISEDILEYRNIPKAGDMVLYRAHDGTISHVGLMENKKNVISKWSWGPLLKHKIFDVPDHYGNEVEFYIIPEETKNFVIAKYISSGL